MYAKKICLVQFWWLHHHHNIRSWKCTLSLPSGDFGSSSFFFVCVSLSTRVYLRSIKCKEVGGAKKKVAPIGDVPRRSWQIFSPAKLLESAFTRKKTTMSSHHRRAPLLHRFKQLSKQIERRRSRLSENNFHKHCNHFKAPVLEHNGVYHQHQ